MGRYRIVMEWESQCGESEYVVEVVGVESQSLVGYYSVVCYGSQEGKLTEMTGHFPIRCIKKMEKIA